VLASDVLRAAIAPDSLRVAIAPDCPGDSQQWLSAMHVSKAHVSPREYVPRVGLRRSPQRYAVGYFTIAEEGIGQLEAERLITETQLPVTFPRIIL